ncbi:OLC1v1004884C1 [Oldenlandia corymbosa var. corymbosa]|uniref:RING-type E3 ubiquitin transferase n=1 Tax=Oldenlandia corymbosa var. corymbosa TaxID=529605 RepID=A0AAV1DDE4_OLDCO|nr:OLC1v1004884C1 [Oldenlandia corymbosa var. corymbosa]
MEEGKAAESHLTSAAAFVEGGIQDACDDACSICLEDFCESDPSTVTNCKHEFHLQCVLEWCQRSSKCPMCWQPISLKDPGSQELLDAVEHERTIRMNPPRNTTIFHHPTLGDFELQHLPVSATESELEERIIQHLAAAAAMGRARHFARREGQRTRSSAHGRPHFLVFSTNPNAPPAAVATSSPNFEGGVEPEPVMTGGSASPSLTVGGDSTQANSVPSNNSDQLSTSLSGSSAVAIQHGNVNMRRSPTPSSPSSQDRAGPSDFQSFSESLKSRFNALSTRYKESITKSTRGWKEKLFQRNNSAQDIGPDIRRESNVGIATVSQMMENLETGDNRRNETASVSNNEVDNSSTGQSNQHNEIASESSLNEDNIHTPPATSSASS